MNLYTLAPWLLELVELGGSIVLILIVLAMCLWALIIERILFYQFTFPKLLQLERKNWLARPERNSWSAQKQRHRSIGKLRSQLSLRLPLIQTMVKICPLLGLLGTVLGMLEVFDAVATLGSNNPRATASGVSKATLSTLMGMVVAISGLLVSGYLARRAGAQQETLAENFRLET